MPNYLDKRVIASQIRAQIESGFFVAAEGPNMPFCSRITGASSREVTSADNPLGQSAGHTLEAGRDN